MVDRCDLALLRILGLKGMADDNVLSGALRSADWAERLEAALADGLVRRLPRGSALTPAGREVVKASLVVEAAGTDAAAMHALYELFCGINSRFKSLMHSWQLRVVNGAEVPNDHSDAAYDGTIIASLGEIDSALAPMLGAMVELAPRLAPYPARFADALARLRAGDASMMARPLVDSYHTVWFELHEELIGLSGRTRAEEAAAGRGD